MWITVSSLISAVSAAAACRVQPTITSIIASANDNIAHLQQPTQLRTQTRGARPYSCQRRQGGTEPAVLHQLKLVSFDFRIIPHFVRMLKWTHPSQMKHRKIVKGTLYSIQPLNRARSTIFTVRLGVSPPSGVWRPVSLLSYVSKTCHGQKDFWALFDHYSSTTFVKSFSNNATSTTLPINTVPTLATVKPTQTIEFSMGPPSRQCTSLSTTTTPLQRQARANAAQRLLL